MGYLHGLISIYVYKSVILYCIYTLEDLVIILATMKIIA